MRRRRRRRDDDDDDDAEKTTKKDAKTAKNGPKTVPDGPVEHIFEGFLPVPDGPAEHIFEGFLPVPHGPAEYIFEGFFAQGGFLRLLLGRGAIKFFERKSCHSTLECQCAQEDQELLLILEFQFEANCEALREPRSSPRIQMLRFGQCSTDRLVR